MTGTRSLNLLTDDGLEPLLLSMEPWRFRGLLKVSALKLRDLREHTETIR